MQEDKKQPPPSILDEVKKEDGIAAANASFDVHTMPKKFLSMRPTFKSDKRSKPGSFSLKSNLIIGIIIVLVIGALMVLAAVLFLRSVNKDSNTVDLPYASTNITPTVTDNNDNSLTTEDQPEVEDNRESLLDTSKWVLFENGNFNYSLKHPDVWSISISSAHDDPTVDLIELKDNNNKIILSINTIDNAGSVNLENWLLNNDISTAVLEEYSLNNIEGYKYNNIIESKYSIYVVLGSYIYNITLDETDDYIDSQIQARLLTNFEFLQTEFEEELEVIPNPDPATDSDKDGLSDLEEVLYTSDKSNRDTDGDGYTDGDEVANLYNPLISGSARLYDSGLVDLYQNIDYNYRLNYPSTWTIKSDEGITLFQSSTGEFIQVLVESDDISGYTSVRDWYRDNISASGNLSDIKIAGQTGIRTPNGLNVYLLNSNKIYQLIYNTNIRPDANFMTTFDMVIKSFKFID